MPLVFPAIMVVVAGLYLTQFFSLFYHFAIREADLLKGFSAGPADIFLTGMAFWVMAYVSDPRGRNKMYRWLVISAYLVVFSGLIGIFSRVRLSKLLSYALAGFSDEGIRLQHHLGTIFALTDHPVHLYMPIGFMNTHLTYAIQLAFVFPYFFYKFLNAWVMQDGFIPDRKTLLSAFMPFLAAVVLLVNNGRSAIFGLLFTLLISLYFFIRVYWKRRSLRILWAGGSVLFLASVTIGAVLTFMPGNFQFLGRISNPLEGKSKNTDYQRQFLWRSVYDIIKERPVTGTGPGGFEQAVYEKILKYSQEKPALWFGYEIIQRGHAHNDYLHQWAVSGIAALILYITFMLMLFNSALKKAPDFSEEFWKWGPFVIIIAGFFQCYFLSDETLLPFWIFTGLLIRHD
jgi:O-antigen ligase